MYSSSGEPGLDMRIFATVLPGHYYTIKTRVAIRSDRYPARPVNYMEDVGFKYSTVFFFLIM